METARRARRITRIVLHEWGLAGEDIDGAVLIVSEMVTNSVAHALPPLRLGLHHVVTVGVIRVEVTDGGPARHSTRRENFEPDEHGRGGLIVARLRQLTAG
ncbi:ATP-binding protein [Streptomyces olivochromogenes]|uniref:ATP-binding protein n=1 Tax=Streptomyces olivochromogenes TaxID=1963 RepID=UPI001F24BE3C|nr:ATP-binding protein [Streptomyces olivochromogenes]MCF3134677.1 ATP-binding protein [Streptomyces olivochromogenes]